MDDNQTKPGLDEEITRREAFRKTLRKGVVAGGVVVAGFAGWKYVLPQVREQRKYVKAEPRVIANISEFSEPNSYKAFFYPNPDDPRDRALLIRLPDRFKPLISDQYGLPQLGLVALSGICTHRGCTIDFNSKQRVAGAPILGPCACHLAVFNAINGIVLSGPARQPLPVIKLSYNETSGEIIALNRLFAAPPSATDVPEKVQLEDVPDEQEIKVQQKIEEHEQNKTELEQEAETWGGG